MQVRINLAQNINDQLKEEASRRGLTIVELVKWIIGSYVMYQNSAPISVSYPSIPDNLMFSTNKISKIAEMMANQLIASGEFKCSTCTLPLDSEAISTGICNNCGMKI
ncbi:MAG: hypothetical protein KKD44_27045 [Proteobacteria bacterium]|nr:hypothetical protein [Pseudomonadota bacterium]